MLKLLIFRSRFLCVIVADGAARVNYHAIETPSSRSNCLIERHAECLRELKKAVETTWWNLVVHQVFNKNSTRADKNSPG